MPAVAFQDRSPYADHAFGNREGSNDTPRADHAAFVASDAERDKFILHDGSRGTNEIKAFGLSVSNQTGQDDDQSAASHHLKKRAPGVR
jgi:hypothetical protein